MIVLGFVVIVSLALTLTTAETMKNILITGANSGIGFALTKRLILEKGCFVYMGSRSVERGEAAVTKLISDHPDTNGKVEMINIDVTSQPSITSAAEELKRRDGRRHPQGLPPARDCAPPRQGPAARRGPTKGDRGLPRGPGRLRVLV